MLVYWIKLIFPSDSCNVYIIIHNSMNSFFLKMAQNSHYDRLLWWPKFQNVLGACPQTPYTLWPNGHHPSQTHAPPKIWILDRTLTWSLCFEAGFQAQRPLAWMCIKVKHLVPSVCMYVYVWQINHLFCILPAINLRQGLSTACNALKIFMSPKMPSIPRDPGSSVRSLPF